MNRWRLRSELVWAGSETVSELLFNLQHGKRTVVKLPFDCHPLLSRALYGAARVRGRIDVTADSTLLLRLAALDEFAVLGDLANPVRDSGTRLRLISPRPHLVFNFRADGPVIAGRSPRDLQLASSRIA
jgi:hypothetical protein